MTSCGHNFCGNCIKECLNRKHACPCCNHAEMADGLMKNHHHDRIVTILIREKEEASKRYFEKLIQNPNQNASNSVPMETDSSIPTKTQLSPIEEVFQKHLKKSLLAYQHYYHELEVKLSKTKENIRADYVKRMQQANQNYNPQSDANNKQKEKLDTEITLLTAECEAKMIQIDESFKTTVQLLMESYDQSLEGMIPAPSFLPVTVTLSIPSRQMNFKKIIIKPTDSAADLKAMLEKKFAETGNPLFSYSQSNIFVLKRNLASEDGKDEEGIHSQDEMVIGDEQRPLLQYKIQQGDLIILKGELLMKSDAPKSCFSTTYEKGKDMVMDYFTCKDCKFNWICKPCAESCHKGHNLSEYITNHKPTWACCYCLKNKRCKLVKAPPSI